MHLPSAGEIHLFTLTQLSLGLPVWLPNYNPAAKGSILKLCPIEQAKDYNFTSLETYCTEIHIQGK